MGRLDDNPTLLQALHNNTPFVYAHLIKFERPSKDVFKVSRNSFKSKKASNYAYITDGGYDIAFDDGSTDFEGTANGVQNYVANRVTNVGSFTDTIDLKIANVSLKLDATPIDSSMTANFTVSTAGPSNIAIQVPTTESFSDSEFRPGDIVTFTSGLNSELKYRINRIHSLGTVLDTTPIPSAPVVARGQGQGPASATSTIQLETANSDIKIGAKVTITKIDGTTQEVTVTSNSGTSVGISSAVAFGQFMQNLSFSRETQTHSSTSLTLKLDSQEILGLLHSTAAERHYFTNKSITIYKAFFYADAPHTFIGSPVKIFEGTITSASFEEDPTKGTSITWQASTFMNSFNRVNGRITSDALHRAVTGNRGQPLHAFREEYAYDLGFMHAENSVSALVNYTDTETYMKYRKKKMGPFGMFGSTRVPYEATRIVERELDLRFDLQAKYLPVVYGVQKIPGIPVFTDIAPQTAATNNSVFVFTAHALCEGPIQGVLNYFVDGESKIALDPEDAKVRSVTADGNTQAQVNETSESQNIEVTGDASAGEVAGGEPTSSLTNVDSSKVTLDGTTTMVLTGLHPGIKVGEAVFGAGIIGNTTVVNITETDDGNTEITLSIAAQTGVSASGNYMFDNPVLVKIDTGFGSGWAYIPASATTGETITNADTVVQAAIEAAEAAGVDVTSDEALSGASISGFEADFIRNNPLNADSYQQLTTTSASGYTHEQMEATQKPTQVLEFHMGLPLQQASSILTSQSLSTLPGSSSSTPPTPKGGFLSQDRTDRKSRAAYWGPAHTLLDTAYVATSNTLNAEDTTIPELEYIVKGKMINCYNYDGSFEHSGLGHYGTEAHTNFMVGDVVQIKTSIPFTSTKVKLDSSGDIVFIGAGIASGESAFTAAANGNLLNTPNTRIIEKFEVFQNEGDVVKYRYRWDISPAEVALLTEAKRFYMERSSNKWHMLTYDAEDIGELTTDAPGATPVTVAERFTAKVTRTSTSGSFVGTLSDITVNTITDYTLTDCNVVLYVSSDTGVYSDIGTGGYSYSTSIFKANIVAVGSNYELRIADFKGDRAIPTDTRVFIVDQFKLSTSASSTDDYYNGVNYKAIAFYETGVMNDTGRAGKSFPMPMRVLDYVGSTRKITISLSSIHGIPPVGTVINFSTFATIQRQNKLEEMLGDVGSGDVRSSINYALITLDYLTNTRYGAGIPFDQIDLDSFLLAAQECDTQSEVTVHINGTPTIVVGRKFRNGAINSNGAEYFQGTVKSVKTFGGDTFVTFTNVVGKLTHKANSFQTRQIGELVYSETANDNNLRKITSAGSQRDPATTVVQVPNRFDSSGNPTSYVPFDIFTKDRLHADNLGATLFNRNSSAITQNDAALLLYSTFDSQTISIKQGVGNPIRTETGESGYSFYDSDAVTYWKYQGWEAPKQRYATRHQGGLTIDTSRPVLDNLKGILNHFNGMLFTAGGKFHLKVEAARDNTGQESDANFNDNNSLLDIKTRYITDEDIIGKISLKDEGFSKSYNTVNASISDPKLHFDDRSVSYFVGEYKDQDSGIERSANFSMPGITNYFNARMAAKQVLDKSRLTRSISFEMRPVGTQILAGDLIRVKYPRFGWDTGSEVLFRVTSVTLKPNCLINISASEYSDDVYLITRNTKSRFFSDSTVTPLRKIPSVPVFSTPSSASNSSPIVLGWSASDGIDIVNGGYEIWRATSLGNAATPITTHASLLAEVPATQTTFTDIKAESTTLQTFYYWIRAFNISQPQNTSAKVKAPRRYYSAFNDDASGGQSKVVNASLKALEESLVMSFSGLTLVKTDEEGNNPDFSEVGGQITIELGNTDITSQVTSFVKSNLNGFSSSDFSITSGGAYTISGMTGESASLTVTASIPANAITGLSAPTTIAKVFTLRKQRAAKAGRSVSLDWPRSQYDETGGNPSPSSVTITATPAGNTGTAFFEFLKSTGGSYSQVQSSSTTATYTYNYPNTFSQAEAEKIQVRLREDSASSSVAAVAFLSSPAVRKGDTGNPGVSGYTVRGSNENHTFVADTTGAVSMTGFLCDITVRKGSTLYSYASTGSATGTFKYGTITATNVTQVVNSSTGRITLAGSSAIASGLTVITGSLLVPIIDNENGITVTNILITFSKSIKASRDGGIFTFEESTNGSISAANASDFAGTLTNAAAQAAATAVIAASIDGFIRPNDRVTVTDNSADKAGTRVYNGTGTTSGGSVAASDFSSLVVETFSGSVIVDGTLSADKLAANTTTTNTLNVGSNLVLANAGQFYTTNKTSYSDNDAGFFLGWDGSKHQLNLGNSTDYIKWDGSNLQVAGSIFFDNASSIGLESFDNSTTGFTNDDTADSKAAVFRQNNVPTSGVKAGDIWIDTNDNNKLYVAATDGSDEVKAGEWVLAQDSSSASAAASSASAAASSAANAASTADGKADDAQDTADSKVRVFRQSSIPTAVSVGDIWVNTTNGANAVYVAASVGANEIKSGEWIESRDGRTQHFDDNGDISLGINVGSQGHIRGGINAANNSGTGVFLGFKTGNTTTPFFSVGNPFATNGKGITWDGTNLNVRGNITFENASNIGISSFDNDSGFTDDTTASAAANAASSAASAASSAQGDANTALDKSQHFDTNGDISLGINVGTAGHIRGGQTGFNTGNSGFFLGYSSGYRFSVGDPSGNRLTWNGTTLFIQGSLRIAGSSTTLTETNTLNSNTTAEDVLGAGKSFGDAAEKDESTIQSNTLTAADKDDVGLGNLDNDNYNSSGDMDGGHVGGWNIDSTAIFSGTKDTSGYTTGGITFNSAGSIHAKEFYIDTSGNAHFKGNIDSGGTVSAQALDLDGTTLTGGAGGLKISTSGVDTLQVASNAITEHTMDHAADRIVSKNTTTYQQLELSQSITGHAATMVTKATIAVIALDNGTYGTGDGINFDVKIEELRNGSVINNTTYTNFAVRDANVTTLVLPLITTISAGNTYTYKLSGKVNSSYGSAEQVKWIRPTIETTMLKR